MSVDMNGKNALCAGAGLAAMAVGLAWAVGLVPVSSAKSAPASTPDLAQMCNARGMQALASGLRSTRVEIKQVEEDPKFPDGTRYVAQAGNLPAYCQVTGSYVTNPKTGRTANFLATFPANWNGKYLQLGCSGHCGNFAVSNPATTGITVTNTGHPGQIIELRYSSFATDEGHVGMEPGVWAEKRPGQVDEEALTDYYYRAHKVLTGLGKEFTTAFYRELEGRPHPITRSYFSGCSGGGRDAYVVSSYFPEAFDGIVGGSAYNLVGTGMHAVAIAAAAARPNAAISPDLLALVDPIVKAKCDGLDGVNDGLIQNPQMCNFRPETDLPKCTGDKPGGQCFTQAQIETLSVVISALTDETGKVVQPGFSVSELLPTQTSGAVSGLGEAMMKVFVHKNDPGFVPASVLTFRSGGPGPVTGFHAVIPRAEVERAYAAAGQGVGHIPENWAKAIQSNRKILLWHNFSDDKLPPFMAINHYKQLARLHGGYARLQPNVRLFMVPGTSHCNGGMDAVGPNNFDVLGAIDNWVDKGIAPDAIPARSYFPLPQGGVNFTRPMPRTMPLCKFPEMAHYSGKGDVNDGRNWSCPAGDTGLLRVGENGRRGGVVE